MRGIIYTPSGRAGEYGRYAANLYRTCPSGCRYCFNVGMHGRKAEDYFRDAVPVQDALVRLRWDCEREQFAEPIFLSFIGDVYANGVVEGGNITREAIGIIKDSGNNVRILTKGYIPDEDLGLLGPGDEVGVTLTLLNPEAELFEPGACDPGVRMENLRRAKALGLKTWASFEPVIAPVHTLLLLNMVSKCLDLAKIGCSNHLEKWDWPSAEWRQRVEGIDWRQFALDAKATCERLGLDYYLKADLRRYAEEAQKGESHE